MKHHVWIVEERCNNQWCPEPNHIEFLRSEAQDRKRYLARMYTTKFRIAKYVREEKPHKSYSLVKAIDRAVKLAAKSKLKFGKIR